MDGLGFDFSTATWFTIGALICYLLIQLIRGKFGKLPYVTPWVEKLGKEQKTLLIMALFGISGVLSSLGVDKITFGSLLNGLMAGIALGIGTVGCRNVSKDTINGIKKLQAGQPDPDPEDLTSTTVS